MSSTRDQAVLLLLATRLASSRLFSTRRDGEISGTRGARRLESLLGFHECAVDGVVEELWRSGRNLVRRNVGQAGCELATGSHVSADPQIATAGVDHSEPP